MGELGELYKLLSGDIMHFIKIIAARLHDEDEKVVVNAATALGELKSPEAIAYLIEIIDSPSESVRLAVVTSIRSLMFWLSDIEGKNRLTYAMMAMLKDQSAPIRAASVETLGYLENSEALDALLEALSDQDSSVRENATAALGSFNFPNVIEALLGLINDSSVVVRWNAVTSLNKIGDRACIGPISKLINDPDESVRLAAKSFIDSFPAES